MEKEHKRLVHVTVHGCLEGHPDDEPQRRPAPRSESIFPENFIRYPFRDTIDRGRLTNAP